MTSYIAAPIEPPFVMENNFEPFNHVEYVKKQPVWAFCLLSFFTFGIYNIFWFYKSWRFLKYLYNWDIYPFWRAVFSIFFVHNLFEHINDLAVEKGHPGISSNGYGTGYVITSISQRVLNRVLPGDLSIIALFILTFLFLIPTVKQLNYLYELAHPNEYRPTFNPGELVALLLGAMVMALVFAGLLME